MKRDIFFYGIYLIYEIMIVKYSILETETYVLFIIYKRQDNIDSRFFEYNN